MIASSTSMPTARISENSTTMFTVSPARKSASTPMRNEAGMATPTMADARGPSVARMMMKTSTTAVSTEFCSSESISRTSRERSLVKLKEMLAGQVSA